MKEAKIILPIKSNNGRDLMAVHTLLRSNLIAAFGGVTATNAFGAWRSPSNQIIEEAVAVYSVAADSTRKNREAFARIAMAAGKDAGQEAMYFVDLNGDAHIKDVK